MKKIIGIIGIMIFLISTLALAEVNWTESVGSLTQNYWGEYIYVSSDGQTMVAPSDSYGGTSDIRVSTNGGTSFTTKFVLTGLTYTTPMSEDGLKIVFSLEDNGQLFISEDAGDTWINKTGNGKYVWFTSMSGDGSKIIQGGDDELYISTNDGDNWTNPSSYDITPHLVNVYMADLSNDGEVIIFQDTNANGSVMISTDGGDTFTTTGLARGKWYSVDVSPAGTEMCAVLQSGEVHFSYDTGNNWDSYVLPGSGNVQGCSIAGDVIAVSSVNNVYVSEDAGNTWNNYNFSTSGFYPLGMSSDGTKIAVAPAEGDIWIGVILASGPVGPQPNVTEYDGNTTDFTLVPDVENVTDVVLEDTTAGKIEFKTPINASGADIDTYIEITPTEITIIVESLNPTFNTSAVLTFYNVVEDDPVILVNGVLCGVGSCENISIINGTVVFSVLHFTTYSVTGNSSLGAWDSSDFETVYEANNLVVYANYTKLDGTPITNLPAYNGTCEVRFNDDGWGSYNAMTYSASSTLYQYTTSFGTAGTYPFNVQCTSSISDFNNTVSDSIVVSSRATLGITATQTIMYTAFGLIAIGIIVLSAFALISVFSNGDVGIGVFVPIAVGVIGIGIVLLVGYLIVSNVGTALIG